MLVTDVFGRECISPVVSRRLVLPVVSRRDVFRRSFLADDVSSLCINFYNSVARVQLNNLVVEMWIRHIRKRPLKCMLLQ